VALDNMIQLRYVHSFPIHFSNLIKGTLIWDEPPGARRLNGRPKVSPHSIRGHTSPHSLGPIRMGPRVLLARIVVTSLWVARIVPVAHICGLSARIYKCGLVGPLLHFIGLKMRSLNLVSEWL
jgi:hypothetical protein